MKIELIDQQRRSRSSGLLPLNLFQLSLLSALLCNLAMILCSTTARAAEPVRTKVAQLSPPTEFPPVLSINQPISETPSTSSLPISTEVPLAKETISNQDQLIQEPASTSSPSTFADVAPTSRSISKQASDLEGTSLPENTAQATPSQTETPTPTDSSSSAKPVNNPLIPPPGWHFDVEPYLFLPLDVKGNIFIGRGRPLFFPNRPGVILPNSGFNLGVNTNLSNITSRLTNIFGVLGRIQAWNGNFGIVTDGVYINSGFRSNTNGRTFTLRDRFEVRIPGFQVDTKNTLASFSLAASYRVVTVPFRTITDPTNPSQYYPAISFEVLAGFRYLSLFQSVDFENGPNFEFSGSEFNPMLGGTVKLMLSNNFGFFFRGDTSNLGGGALKQYYNLYGGLDWKFSGSFALRLSYRFNQIEFVKRGPFGGDNGLNLRTQGVQLGLSWQF